MDGLRPDSDEVDSFQQNRTSRTNKKVAKRKESNKEKQVNVGSSKQGADNRPPVSNKTGSNTLLGLIIVMLVVGGVGAGWVYNKQRQELTALRVELKDALGFISQSKLLMARFEGKLSETGVEMAESDTEAQKKLKFLDAEVRKLWGVAYDRNRKSIAANDDLIKKHTSELNIIASESGKQNTKLNDLVKSVSVQQSSSQLLQSELLAIKGTNEQLLSQIKEVEDAANGAAMIIRQEIQQLAENDEVVVRVQQNEVAIESFDASRLQLNERLVVLDNKLNDLQRSIEALQPVKGK